MIIRSLLLRDGRRALAKSLTPIRQCRRAVTSESTRVSNPFGREAVHDSGIQETPSIARGDRFDIRDPDHPVAQQLLFQSHIKSVTGKVGSTTDPTQYHPYQLLGNPPWPKDITLELLMASQAHLGHATSLWHPGNAKYIFGIRGVDDPIHVISLDVTAAYLRRACKIVQGVAERGGLILFVGTRNGQARAVVRAAELAKGCHLFAKWTPGTITNGQQILGKCTKKVVDEFDQEVPGFEDQLHDKAAIKPDLVVCLNPVENYVLLHECALNNIPTIGVVDTDCNPTWVTYPIPANDDSLRCIQVVAGVLGRAGQLGQMARRRATERGQVPRRAPHNLRAPTQEELNRRREQEALEAADKEFIRLDELEAANAAAAPVEVPPQAIEPSQSSLLAETSTSVTPDVDLESEQEVPAWGEPYQLSSEDVLQEVDPSLIHDEDAKAPEPTFDGVMSTEQGNSDVEASPGVDDLQPETADEAALLETFKKMERMQTEDVVKKDE